MLKPGPYTKPWHKNFQIVFAPIEGKKSGSFEDFINRALDRGYRIYGPIEYVSIHEQSEIWGLCSIQKLELILPPSDSLPERIFESPHKSRKRKKKDESDNRRKSKSKRSQVSGQSNTEGGI